MSIMIIVGRQVLSMESIKADQDKKVLYGFDGFG